MSHSIAAAAQPWPILTKQPHTSVGVQVDDVVTKQSPDTPAGPGEASRPLESSSPFTRACGRSSGVSLSEEAKG